MRKCRECLRIFGVEYFYTQKGTIGVFCRDCRERWVRKQSEPYTKRPIMKVPRSSGVVLETWQAEALKYRRK